MEAAAAASALEAVAGVCVGRGDCQQLTGEDRRVGKSRKAVSRADGIPDQASPITDGHCRPHSQGPG